VQAAWAVVLWKLGGEDEVVLASAPARRLHAELETAVGAFVRPLPVRLHPSGELTAGELAVQLARAEELAERWQDWAPLEDGAAGAGFVESERFDPVESGGLTVSCLDIAPPALFPLAVEWDGVDCRLRFEPDALDAVSAERTARRLACVLASIASAPETRLEQLSLIDDAEVQRLTVDLNRTATEVPRAAVHELVAAAAALASRADAVVDEGGTLSYDALERRANQLAHRLRSAGAGPDAVVGLCTDRSGDMVVGLLGILKSGAAYLPLNFEHPAARLAHQLRETNAVAVVTQEGLLDDLPAFESEVVCLDRDRASLDAEPVEAPEVDVSPENLAYVMYTSGSTGRPKGVGVTHGSLCNYVHAIAGRLGADRERLAFGMVTAISTDLGNTALFSALCTGGTLVLVSPAAAADSAAAAAYLRANPIDVLKITPSHLNALLVGADGRDVLPRRWLVVGGEALSWDIVARVRELGECRILNHYGPTETTVGSCIFPVEHGANAPLAATVPIGSPLANTACYVLDEAGACLPEGAPGELHISGAGVARGYVGRPDLTDERFLPDPFAGEGARMYATGDLVRRLPDGTLEFLGRRDDQVKIRGFRVEPAEIEAALRAHAEVEEAVVVASEDGRGEHRLVAYVVAAKDLSTETLRRHLADSVPEFMIPSAFVSLASLPRTASGKVDRLSLPAPENVAQTAGGPAYVAPRTPVEEAVAAIWADVLGLEQVGVDDDFFALGGHSLLATQIVAQVRSDFSIDLPLHALFGAPTVATLSQQIVELMGAAPGEGEQLLAELEGMSDEEVARLLEEDEAAGRSAP
jgi:amino acid adenylation domain-containing protein